MSDTAIRVQNLGKRYRIGVAEKRPDNLREAVGRLASAPFRYLRTRLREADPEEVVWALKDVSFEVRRGEVLGIIGRNGAGKTTLLKILSRITEPTEGRAVINGRVGSLLEVGTGFHPELTGRENIYLNGAILGMTRAEIDGKFDEIVDFSGVEKFIDTPVKRYSSGMRVRLGFAVAAHLDPEILLVDEVLAVGDAGFQKKCLGKMGQVAQEGRTVLFVSHNMTAVQGLCQRVIWLEEGSILEEGQPARVVSDYLQASMSGVVTVRKWENMSKAPGNEQVRVRRVLAHSLSGNGASPLYLDRDIQVAVEFWSLKPDQELSITLHFVTSDAAVAFSTGTVHNAPLRGKRLNEGLYRAWCRIPANLLNRDTYRIRLLVVENQSRVVFKMEEALVLRLVDASEWREAYFGERPGAVGPILEWHMRSLDEGAGETGAGTGAPNSYER
jgi:lipopolysaccharide transport system ATP-binding protein